MDRLLCQDFFDFYFPLRTPYKENESPKPSTAFNYLDFQVCYLNSLLSADFLTFQIR